MKKLKNYITFANESIRDAMKPKSYEDILDSGISPIDLLYGSIQNKWLEGIKIAIERGVDVNQENTYGSNPLIEATYKNFFEGVKLLLENGADVNKKNPNDDTALLLATYYGRKKIVKELLKYNPDPNVINSNGDDLVNIIDVTDQFSDTHMELEIILTEYIKKYNENNK